MESSFVLKRHFTSLYPLEESGEAVHWRQMGSELDLNTFARFTVVIWSYKSSSGSQRTVSYVIALALKVQSGLKIIVTPLV
jgi:hypothetical protein